MKILNKNFISGAIVGCMLLSSTGAHSFDFFKKESPKSSLLFFSKFFRKPKPKPYPFWMKATACVSIALFSLYLFDKVCRQDGDCSPGIFGRLKEAIFGSSRKEEFLKNGADKDELDYTMDACCCGKKKKNKIFLSQLYTVQQTDSTSCGFHSLKNAQFMRQFFRCKPKNKKEKINILRKINSFWEAEDFLNEFDTGYATNSQYLQKIINQKQQKDSNYDDLYVLEAIDQARLHRQAYGDNPIFIINSGGTTAQKAKEEAFDKVKEKKKEKENEAEELKKELDKKENELEENVEKKEVEDLKKKIKEKKEEIKKVKPEEGSDPVYHYYVAAIKKKENKCYVLDSLGTNRIRRGNIQRLFNIVKGNG